MAGAAHFLAELCEQCADSCWDAWRLEDSEGFGSALQWLRFELLEEALELLRAEGRLRFGHGRFSGPSFSIWTAYSDKLDWLKWGREQEPPCPWNGETASAAARHGHLALLMWARAQDPPCPWGRKTTSAAAEWGQLDTLKWLHEAGCPWIWADCYRLARLGDYAEMIEWLKTARPK